MLTLSTILNEADPEDWVTASDLARALGKSPATLQAWRSRGGDAGPPFAKIGGGAFSIYYKVGDFRDWWQRRVASSAAQARLAHSRLPGSRSTLATGDEG